MNRTLVAPMQAFVASSRAVAAAAVATTSGSGTTASHTAAHGHWCAGPVHSMTSATDTNSKSTMKRTARHLGSAAT